MSSTIQLTGGGLRSRKIDHKKPLAVYRHYDIPDLDENAAINKIASVVATGVEKEEEDVYLSGMSLTLFVGTPSAGRLKHKQALGQEPCLYSHSGRVKGHLRLSRLL